jgi:C-terminal processing protease CtpA/Prc
VFVSSLCTASLNPMVYLHLDMAIKKMLATLDDPFTRFLEPEKFKSLRV